MTDSVRPLPPPSMPPRNPSLTPEPGPMRSDPPMRSSDPPARSEVSEVDLARVPPSFLPERAIDEQIEELERWAMINVRHDRNERVRFWVLRGVAFLGAAGGAVAVALATPKAGVALSALAALAITIDAAWPAPYRNPAMRAVHDLRELQNTLKLRWDKVRLAHPDPNAPQRVAHAMTMLDAVQAKREEIGKYLASADSSRGVSRK
jgi:hypothetical protein